MNKRPTQYRQVPLQAQSMGTQQGKLAIYAMFQQSCCITTADGLGLLIDGNPGSCDRVDAVIRKCGVTEADLTSIPQIGKALPKLPSLDFSALALTADKLLELADDNGAWQRQYEQVAAGLIDHKIAELTGG